MALTLPLGQRERGGTDLFELAFDPPGSLAPLYTDPRKLAQILATSSFYALKVTERGRVRVTAEPAADAAVHVCVELPAAHPGTGPDVAVTTAEESPA